MATISQALKEASQLIDRLDARLLLCFCLSKPRTYLIAHDREEIDEALLTQYKALVKRRHVGEPFPYITGTQEFFSRAFKVTPAVLIPRPDTETLIEEVLSEIEHHPAQTLLDLGTGSGCIAITLAKECPSLQVFATDFSKAALQVACTNAQMHKASIKFSHGSWFNAIADNAVFDIIVSNPPYIEKADVHLENLTYEPISALTDGGNGLKDLKEIISGAPKHLKPGGLLVLEHGWNQGKAVRDLFDLTLWETPQTLKDLGDNDRITKARLKV